VRTAVRWLFDVKAPFVRTSATPLKVGRFNFYPDKGTIYLDGDRAPLPQRGFHAFQELRRTRERLGAAGIIRDPNPAVDSNIAFANRTRYEPTRYRHRCILRGHTASGDWPGC
jgi:hypothetical protein